MLKPALVIMASLAVLAPVLRGRSGRGERYRRRARHRGRRQEGLSLGRPGRGPERHLRAWRPASSSRRAATSSPRP
ncbi:MAG: hypothetical protein M0C28_21040 [Candidatus Moduliflexus flocculans]|nr:hypothetical protein [Candidatus Moduliflexus flocculans]